jgi:hypothetical protein
MLHDHCFSGLLCRDTSLNCWVHSCSWEADNFWATQDISHILWNMKVHYNVPRPCVTFHNILILMVSGCQPSLEHPLWKTNPWMLLHLNWHAVASCHIWREFCPWPLEDRLGCCDREHTVGMLHQDTYLSSKTVGLIWKLQVFICVCVCVCVYVCMHTYVSSEVFVATSECAGWHN